ncbi:hypothetical protein IFT59_07240 [Rhizobium sp. CFBP 8752]|uniref:hypothetical protein n=1 Tax=Rhizobium sp. CFBP 8752 TaxID=2775301 RepID=UPI001781E0E3|nr:hypothetical protein [Rhizobium sp. CFBP 8752]MBD8663046.1 hypothetical protein [Rhizobium sp. CFBP 8752]
MLDETQIGANDELDIMVLTLKALEGHWILFTPAQRDALMPYVRGLTVYEARRPAARRRTNVVDFETALIKARLSKTVAHERRSALAEGRTVLQHGVNELGDCIYAEDID